MEIRKEQTTDHRAIHELTSVAFAPKAFSDGTEPDIIDNLRSAGDLTLSLVALNNSDLAGHVAFSPVTIGDTPGRWYGLGPVSVLPAIQGTGIGTALIEEGLRQLRENGAAGCALIGDPGYYCRFGFISDGKVHYQDLPDRLVQWIGFSNQTPAGTLLFSPAFGD